MSRQQNAPGKELVVGVDLGGTKVAAGVFSSDGVLRGEEARYPSRAEESAEATLDSLYRAVEDALASAAVGIDDVVGIGIGSPGPLDPKAGKILHTPNLPNLRNFAICDAVGDRFGTRVEISNDGNCFALAVATYGRGRGHGIVLGVTIGTGCGVGIVINGQIVEGPRASAGEVFLARVGDRNYDEAISGTGLERLWREMHGSEVDGKQITLLADEGDERALRVFDAFADQAALGLGTFAALLDPAVIALGGSVVSAYRHFGERLQRQILRYIAPAAGEPLQVVPSDLGSTAGAAGAAALLFTGGRLV